MEDKLVMTKKTYWMKTSKFTWIQYSTIKGFLPRIGNHINEVMTKKMATDNNKTHLCAVWSLSGSSPIYTYQIQGKTPLFNYVDRFLLLKNS